MDAILSHYRKTYFVIEPDDGGGEEMTSRFVVAIDDKKAVKHAYHLRPTLHIVSTEDLMVSMITSGLMNVEEADAIKEAWASSHKFKLKVRSFIELI